MAVETAVVIETFRRNYPDSPAPQVYQAPGRVNMIGEHTDYNLGFVLPIAIQFVCHAAAAPASDGMLRVYSSNAGEERSWPVDALRDLRPSGDWPDYVAGVARELVLAGVSVHPQRLAIHSDVPLGAGLSSSAAIEVSSALALLAGREIPPAELAQLCRRAENQFVGMPCGIMDQYVSVFGEAGAAIEIDCRAISHRCVR
ncbi:MAG: galactokinase, partial [Bryobacteraceae bacterium]